MFPDVTHVSILLSIEKKARRGEARRGESSPTVRQRVLCKIKNIDMFHGRFSPLHSESKVWN